MEGNFEERQDLIVDELLSSDEDFIQIKEQDQINYQMN